MFSHVIIHIIHSPHFSKEVGATTITTTSEVMINAKVIADTKAMLPLLAGNFPRITQCCDSKYL